MEKYIFIILLCSISACSYQAEPAITATQLCCDANENCAPAPPAPGVCPSDTITTDCDDEGNCVDQE